jgi:RNA polymerase sigma factor (sigma-70 family)
MPPKSDAQLIQDFAEHGTEAAFEEIVSRHANLVYSAAIRQVELSDIAAEVAQSSFVALAQAASSLAAQLNKDATLAGWLCRTARNIALKLRRDEFRRRSREKRAMENLEPTSNSTVDWERVRPVLDDAMSELSESDYDALVLRFFRNQDLRSVGHALGVTDDAAQKRVSRALDKLRDLLCKRGIQTPAAALSMAISSNAIEAGPGGLAARISRAVLLSGAASTAVVSSTALKTTAMTTLTRSLPSPP